MKRNLIIYYSRKGENYADGRIEHLEKGNTEICAEYIQKAVGGDMFEIRTEEEYSADYSECTEEARAELESDSRPCLKEYLDDISGYDNVFVCGPCWWGTYPMAVFSLLERLDFSGKKVIALMTHEGSVMGRSGQDIHRICTGASFGTSLAVLGSDAVRAESTVALWAKNNI